MHYDRTQGPPKKGETDWVVSGFSRKARLHPAISQVSALVLEAIKSLETVDPETGSLRTDYRALNIAVYLLGPLLEVGTACRYTNINYGSSASLALSCIKEKNMRRLYERVWRRLEDRTMVMDFLSHRCQVYEISQADSVWESKSARHRLLQKIHHIAFVVLSPDDVVNGLPDPTHSFASKRREPVGPAEVIFLRRAA